VDHTEHEFRQQAFEILMWTLYPCCKILWRCV